MKKLLIFGLSLLFLFGLSSTESGFAQTQTEVKKATTDGKAQVQNTIRGRYFVDENKDGICDNNKMGAGQGIGRAKNFRGQNFVDKNNDGICDNFPQGRGVRRGTGVGPNFVDKNNDGICDNRSDGMSMRKGMGRKSGNCDGSHRGWRGRK
ncbi:MAG: hypothetical protein A2X61_17025 [Ignavibacteria bacterium GWB2_35_12]|nr:MAG: hypothetical protein A2X63_07755 [Ignavibacteria bacterium GWA2_35_8]OGU38053.1 MAG: hypothetical protein A2X61_17025 [Ignavibacteria bacterium GWB2_35_12]OGU87479.1 MAG: hypothetical protein A2220_17000 [Ignavibacteria bacterium RIFOXYA2_FULL_35_10]OGV25025.1 MAG: hypothetical protein A2475_16600 [Ignavibacteria bacterium RIFOXYC2_FULL_35_21]